MVLVYFVKPPFTPWCLVRKILFVLTVKKKITRFEGLPQFKWNNLGEKAVIGEGSFGAVFVTRYTKDEDCSDSSSVESALVKKNCFVVKKLFVVRTSPIRKIPNMLFMCYWQK